MHDINSTIQYTDTYMYSIYIPRIKTAYGQYTIQQKLFYIGLVTSVDYIPLHYQSGFVNIRSAVVHLKLNYNNFATTELVSHLENGGAFDILINDSGEYLRLLKNRIHNSRISTNIHQVIDSYRGLEQTLADCVKEKQLQDKKIATLEEELKDLRKIMIMIIEKDCPTTTVLRHPSEIIIPYKGKGITRQYADEDWDTLLNK